MRPYHLRATEFARDDARWCLALLHPATDGARVVHVVAAAPALAVQHARHEEQPRERRGLRRAPLDRLEILDRGARAERRVGPAVRQQELAAARTEGREVRVRGGDDGGDFGTVTPRTREIVADIVPRRVAVHEVLEELRPDYCL